MKEIIIGTRGSKLALCQAEEVKEIIENISENRKISLKIIKTRGDKILDVALSKIGDKGLFVKEIESALLNKEIDMAVHSLKDLPSVIPPELFIAAVPPRADYRDVLISKDNLKFIDLPEKSVIGTSSLRRMAQVLNQRKDLVVKDIRGNLDTRLKKLKEEDYSAIIVAAAGLIRMNWKDKISEYFSPDIILPAAGQGALAIEARKDDEEIKKLLKSLNDSNTYQAVAAERSFLNFLEGGCQIPVGALATIKEETLTLKGMVSSLDGSKIFRGQIKGPVEEGQKLGVKLAKKLLGEGAGQVLKELRSGA